MILRLPRLLFVRVADADENLSINGSGEFAAICDFA